MNFDCSKDGGGGGGAPSAVERTRGVLTETETGGGTYATTSEAPSDAAMDATKEPFEEGAQSWALT